MPAKELEDFVVRQIRGIGASPELLQRVLASVTQESAQRRRSLEEERALVQDSLQRLNLEARRLAMTLGQENGDLERVKARLSEIENHCKALELRKSEIAKALAALTDASIDEADVPKSMRLFEPVWEMLTTAEQGRVLGLLLERVSYNSQTGKLEIRFNGRGIQLLSKEQQENK